MKTFNVTIKTFFSSIFAFISRSTNKCQAIYENAYNCWNSREYWISIVMSAGIDKVWEGVSDIVTGLFSFSLLFAVALNVIL